VVVTELFVDDYFFYLFQIWGMQTIKSQCHKWRSLSTRESLHHLRKNQRTLIRSLEGLELS